MNDVEGKHEDGVITDEMREAAQEALYPLPLPIQGDKFFQTDPNPERKWLNDVLSSDERIQGYEAAAVILFQEIERSIEQARKPIAEDQTSAHLSLEHWLVYPMYFLYRHAIELSLKALYARSSKSNPTERLGHKLKDLWMDVRPQISHILDDRLIEPTKAFEAMLNEITKEDPDGQGGRYEMNTKGELMFAAVKPLSVKVINQRSQAMLNYLQH